MARRSRPILVGMACSVALLGACSTGGGNADDASSEPSEQVAPAEGATTTEPPEDPSTNGATDRADSAPEAEPSLPPVSVDDLSELTGNLVLIDSDEQVVITQPDGSLPLVVSDPDTVNSQPTWSRNGSRVAWTSFGADGATLSLATGEGEVTSVPVVSPAFYLSWSPDDTWIGGLRPTAGGMEMFVADIEAQTDRQVSQAQPFYFDWADDDAIVAALGSQLLVDISASDAVNPLRRPLELPLGAFQAPTVLPDGDVIAALILDNENALVRLTGADPEVIATADAPMLISVSPDGQRVAAVVAPDVGGQQAESEVIQFQFDEPIELETGRVTIIDLGTGESQTQPQEQVVAFSWSPDSTTLSLLSLNGSALQWTFSTPEGDVDGAEFFPSARFSQRYLPFFDQYNLSSTAWSPTSDAIVFAGTIDNEAGVFVDLVSDDAGPARITEGEIAFWSPN